MELKKLLTTFVNTRKQIHDYFGYTEDWVTIPLQDNTEYYWSLKEGEQGSGTVRYHENELTKESIEGGETYSAVIYRQRFLPQWVYRKDDFTMVCADTQTDGNKYLMIFDNQKECKGLEEYEY